MTINTNDYEHSAWCRIAYIEKKKPKFFKNKFHFVIHHIRVHGSNIVEKLAVFLQRP